MGRFMKGDRGTSLRAILVLFKSARKNPSPFLACWELRLTLKVASLKWCSRLGSVAVLKRVYGRMWEKPKLTSKLWPLDDAGMNLLVPSTKFFLGSKCKNPPPHFESQKKNENWGWFSYSSHGCWTVITIHKKIQHIHWSLTWFFHRYFKINSKEHIVYLATSIQTIILHYQYYRHLMHLNCTNGLS